MTHAPEPWRVENITHGTGANAREHCYIVAADYPGMGIVAEVNFARVPTIGGAPDWEATARRIVACVNALAGIPVDVIERGAAAVHEFLAWRKMEDST